MLYYCVPSSEFRRDNLANQWFNNNGSRYIIMITIVVCLFQSTLVNVVKYNVNIVTGVTSTTVIYIVTYHFNL